MKQTGSSGSTLGTALMAAGGVVLALAVLWWLSYLGSGATPRSLIFVVVLAGVVAGPLLVAGWMLRSRAPQEAAEAGAFAARRAVVDADVTLRREVGRELEQTLQAIERAAPALTGSAASSADRARRLLADSRDDLARPGYSVAALLEGSAGLGAEQLASVRRYDDLLTSQARRLGELAQRLPSDTSVAATLAESAELVATHVAERETLLGRGRLAAPLRPQEMLEAGATPRRRVDDPVSLSLEDAVSFDGEDFVVRGVLDYFGGGRRWRAYQLHDGRNERWLEVRAGGAQLAWLERLGEPVSPDDERITVRDSTYTAVERGTADVSIESAAGRQDGVLVEYRRYADGPSLLGVEAWPDGQRVLAGRTIAREDLDLWTRPAATQ